MDCGAMDTLTRHYCLAQCGTKSWTPCQGMLWICRVTGVKSGDSSQRNPGQRETPQTEPTMVQWWYKKQDRAPGKKRDERAWRKPQDVQGLSPTGKEMGSITTQGTRCGVRWLPADVTAAPLLALWHSWISCPGTLPNWAMVSAHTLTEHQALVLHQEYLGAAGKVPSGLGILLLGVRKSRCSAVPHLAGQAGRARQGFGLVLIHPKRSSVCKERTSLMGSQACELVQVERTKNLVATASLGGHCAMRRDLSPGFRELV